MNMKHEITDDDAARIRELAAEGFGRNYIAHTLDINSSAVRSVLDGMRKSYSNQLSTRQRQALLDRGFGGWSFGGR